MIMIRITIALRETRVVLVSKFSTIGSSKILKKCFKKDFFFSLKMFQLSEVIGLEIT